ncbi:hypothetical protein ACUN0C_12155 [Faunimonas sp. B44]|uniref:hypothetical protein n=1 Tax=Faunimonas sp. B44 TaxID=3461493 RepID=UPI004043B616
MHLFEEPILDDAISILRNAGHSVEEETDLPTALPGLYRIDNGPPVPVDKLCAMARKAALRRPFRMPPTLRA